MSLDDLLSAIDLQGTLGDWEAPPVVSLELFFQGNDDEGSIGCNLMDHPGIPAFYETLKSIRNRSEVQDVLIEISDLDDGSWPFSERVYVLSSAPQNSVEEWLSGLRPSEVCEGWFQGKPVETSLLGPGVAIYSAWWD